jgi:hypothetical protein
MNFAAKRSKGIGLELGENRIKKCFYFKMEEINAYIPKGGVLKKKKKITK